MSLRPAGLEAHLFPSRACSDAMPVIAPRHPLPGRGNSPGTHYRGCDPAKTSPVRAHPTRLDKIKNLHSLDSIATETYGTHGRSIRVHPGWVGLLDSRVPHNSLPERVEPLETGVARNPGTEPYYPVPDLSWPSPNGQVGPVWPQASRRWTRPSHVV